MDNNKNTIGLNTKMAYELHNLGHSLKGQAIINQASLCTYRSQI